MRRIKSILVLETLEAHPAIQEARGALEQATTEAEVQRAEERLLEAELAARIEVLGSYRGELFAVLRHLRKALERATEANRWAQKLDNHARHLLDDDTVGPSLVELPHPPEELLQEFPLEGWLGLAHAKAEDLN